MAGQQLREACGRVRDDVGKDVWWWKGVPIGHGAVNGVDSGGARWGVTVRCGCLVCYGAEC